MELKLFPLLFLSLLSLPYGTMGNGGNEIEYTESVDLGFFVSEEKLEFRRRENVTSLCITTKYLAENQEELKETFAAIENVIQELKGNAVFKANPNVELIKFVLDSLTDLAEQTKQIRTEILELNNYAGNDEPIDPLDCQVDFAVPSPPLLAPLKKLKVVLENSKTAISDKAKAGASATDIAEVTEVIDLDSRISLNSLNPIYENVAFIYNLHEALLGNEVSEKLLTILQKKVPKLLPVREEKVYVKECRRQGEGFGCRLEVVDREIDEYGYQFRAVPFLFENTIYEIDFGGKNIMDSTKTLLVSACPDDGDFSCLDPQLSSDECLNAINQESPIEIGENCRFKKTGEDSDFFLLGTESGSIVFGPSYSDKLLLILENNHRIFSFPVEVCSFGKLTLREGKQEQTVAPVCGENYFLKTFKYNTTFLATIFNQQTSIWEAFENLIPENLEDIVTILNVFGNILTLPLLFIIIYGCVRERAPKCCKKKEKKKLTPKRRYKLRDALHGYLFGFDPSPSAPDDLESRPLRKEGRTDRKNQQKQEIATEIF